MNPLFNKQSPFYNDNLIYYVCSYGGCGSKMLSNYLSNFGKVFHIHSRDPPNKLEYTGNINSNVNVYEEWFNGVQINDNKNYKVIYIYRNPIYAIYSRFNIKAHLQHIMTNDNNTLKNVINTNRDLYGIQEFFNNYTSTRNRNYNIYCVKYEDFFDNIEKFNETLNIPNVKELYPTKFENTKNMTYFNELFNIYKNLIDKMNNMDFITIV